jgi:hypothetical protein
MQSSERRTYKDCLRMLTGSNFGEGTFMFVGNCASSITTSARLQLLLDMKYK